MTQDLNTPFRGIIRISSKPMKDALGPKTEITKQ
jgi:hypothetical protein